MEIKTIIIKTHIEKNLVNNEPTLVFTDENNTEWVMSHNTTDNSGAGFSKLTKKSECWYFQIRNNTVT